MPYRVNSKHSSRRRRVLLLADRLEELAKARHQLVLQLEELDAQARVVQLEFDELQNIDAPVSSLPEEVLAMVFEAGVLLDELPRFEFATVVSHVTRRWRSVALATPRLWNTIFWDLGPEELEDSEETEKPRQQALLENLEKETNRVAIFLSRSMPAPIDIYISRVRETVFDCDHTAMKSMIKLLHAHFYRCHHLSIRDGDMWCTEQILDELCSGPAPIIIRSIDWGIAYDYEEEYSPMPVYFNRNTPQLKIAQLARFEVVTILYFQPVFRQLVSLRLIGNKLTAEDHALLARALLSMTALDHLELLEFCEYEPHTPPLVHPTIRFLHLHLAPRYDEHDIDIQRFRAASVTTLSIDCARRPLGGIGFTLEVPPQTAFPSLQHLLLVNIKEHSLNLDATAHIFPDIKRLTCQGADPDFEVGHVLAAMGAHANKGDLASTADVSLHWSKLHSIAASGPDEPLHAGTPDSQLDSQVAALQAAGIPVRKLLLPQSLVAHVGGDMMARVGELVEVEDFRLDWPTSFARFDEESD
ncbi:hypothetical protein HWV62_22832 [Athelia sp. TMB]|nr:hypothetical protein HWV62_22832 [Athelia sp. TMB]